MSISGVDSGTMTTNMVNAIEEIKGAQRESSIQALMTTGGLTRAQAEEVLNNLVNKGGYSPDQVAELLASGTIDPSKWTNAAINANDGKPPFTKENDGNLKT